MTTPQNPQNPLPPPTKGAAMTPDRKAVIAALLTGAVGIAVQIGGGADYPVVPPGLLILLAAAGLFAVRNVWTSGLALAATLAISVGGVLAADFRDQLGTPSETAVFLGSLLQSAALLAALAAGAAVLRRDVRGRGRAAA